MRSHKTAIILSVIFGSITLLPSLGFAKGTEAVTKPSKDVTLSFLGPGRIAKVLVKAGDVVSADDPLVKQDDAAEQIKLEQLQAQAKDTINIQAQQADLDQKKVDFDKLEEGRDKGVVAFLELEHARLDVKIAQLRLEVARLDHKQDQRKFEEAKVHLERMKMASPIAGKVEKISVEPGESVNALEEVIRVVRINPLWIDVAVRREETMVLKNGQMAQVKFDDSKAAVVDGRIIYIAAVADAASNTRTVRVEVPNETHRPAGEPVKVSFAPAGSSTVIPKNRQIPQISLNDNKE